MEKVKARESTFKPYDVETGAFSTFERNDIQEKLNAYSIRATHPEEAEELAKELTLNCNTVTALDVMASFLVLRLTQTYTRRPAQLRLLKWCDLKPSVAGTFSDGDEAFLMMPMVKQQGDTKERIIETHPHIVTSDLLKEITAYRDLYKENFFRHINNTTTFELTAEEEEFLFQYLPVFPHHTLFTTDFTESIHDKRELISFFRESIDGFTARAGNLRDKVGVLAKRLDFTSDRVIDMSYGPNRVRHDQATEMAADGYGKAHIAAKLGNTPRVAGRYVDMSPELRAAADQKMQSDKTLPDAFAGRFAEQVRQAVTTNIEDNEVAIEDLEIGAMGKSAHLPHCLSCSNGRPIACYGCAEFRPLSTGNHREFLTKVQSEYDKKKDAGYPDKALYAHSHKIKAIKATIIACDAVNKPLQLEEK